MTMTKEDWWWTCSFLFKYFLVPILLVYGIFHHTTGTREDVLFYIGIGFFLLQGLWFANGLNLYFIRIPTWIGNVPFGWYMFTTTPAWILAPICRLEHGNEFWIFTLMAKDLLLFSQHHYIFAFAVVIVGMIAFDFFLAFLVWFFTA